MHECLQGRQWQQFQTLRALTVAIWHGVSSCCTDKTSCSIIVTGCLAVLQNIVHRDLTSYNLLVTEKWECKLADFNLSRAIKETSIPHSGQINSPEWSAPERLSGQVRAFPSPASCAAVLHTKRHGGRGTCMPLGPLRTLYCLPVTYVKEAEVTHSSATFRADAACYAYVDPALTAGGAHSGFLWLCGQLSHRSPFLTLESRA